MSTLSRLVSPGFLGLLGLFCLPLTGCKETQKIEAQVSELQQKVKAKMDELNAQDKLAAELRKLVPSSAGAGEIGIRNFTISSASDIAALEKGIQQVQAAITEAESELALVKKDLNNLKSAIAR